MLHRSIFKKLAITPLLFFLLAGNVLADTTAPVTNLTMTPSTPNGNNGWYVTPIELKLDATDLESGVKDINYRLNGGTWQKISFSNSLNLAENPSFETTGSTTTGMAKWYASVVDTFGSYSRDIGLYYPGFSTTSARIITTDGSWHGINNINDFAAATPFSNMTASVWAKSSNITGSAYFKIYNVIQDGTGPATYSLIGQSNAITGTTDWTKLSYNFITSDPNTVGVYIDIGLSGAGTLWLDAVYISEAITSASATVMASADGEDQTFEYYSTDSAGNQEFYSCPLTNCTTFDIDQTPPTNWQDSGAFRGVTGSEHEVYVNTTVEDVTSGLSTNSNKYQYTVDSQPTFGRYANLLLCNTAWKTGEWEPLLDYPTIPGTNLYTLITQKTDFCNSNWKVCKTVRFYAEDMAGNTTTKDFCINGPWITFEGEGTLRANQNIDMLAEPEDYNTDGLVELGGNIMNFFTTSTGWVVKNSERPKEYTYQTYFDMIENKTTITSDLIASSGVYYVNGNFTADNQSIPNSYDDNTFNQVVFVNGDLTIENDLVVDDASTALFIVKGNVNIDKSIDYLYAAIFADGSINTAFDIKEGESTKTLYLKGIYSANKFLFKRNLQGANNQADPSDSFTFEPKYMVQIRDLFGIHNISWRNIE